MKKGSLIVRVWMLCGPLILLGGMLAGCGHDPNRGIDVERARAAADRVHTPPDPRVKTGPGHGG